MLGSNLYFYSCYISLGEKKIKNSAFHCHSIFTYLLVWTELKHTIYGTSMACKVQAVGTVQKNRCDVVTNSLNYDFGDKVQ